MHSSDPLLAPAKPAAGATGLRPKLMKQVRQVWQTLHDNFYTETTEPFSIHAIAASGLRATKKWHAPVRWRYAGSAIGIGGFARRTWYSGRQWEGKNV